MNKIVGVLCEFRLDFGLSALLKKGLFVMGFLEEFVETIGVFVEDEIEVDSEVLFDSDLRGEDVGDVRGEEGVEVVEEVFLDVLEVVFGDLFRVLLFVVRFENNLSPLSQNLVTMDVIDIPPF